MHPTTAGALLALAGSIAGAAGDGMVRFVHIAKRPIPLRPCIWASGIFLTTAVDSLLTLGALVYAPASAVTPFAGAHIALSVGMSAAWFEERLSVWGIVSVAAIIVGVVCCAIGCASDAPLVMEVLLKSLSNTISLVFIGALFILAVASSMISSCKHRYKTFTRIDHIAISASSGIWGGGTYLVGKIFGTLLIFMIHSKTNIKEFGIITAVLVALIAAAFLQVYYLNLGLKRHEAIYIIPAINSVVIFVGIIGGILILNERPNDIIIFSTGMTNLLVGVPLLAWCHFKRPHTDIPSQDTLSSYPPSIYVYPADDDDERRPPPTAPGLVFRPYDIMAIDTLHPSLSPMSTLSVFETPSDVLYYTPQPPRGTRGMKRSASASY
eukprot:GHVO01027172.1.p1 GENE.GHVO01027172.1~~GHVO01027172.1.p1  ORF type:complete len:381 (+),score=75.14 GHVO01027172.1:1001-2143(+)